MRRVSLLHMIVPFGVTNHHIASTRWCIAMGFARTSAYDDVDHLAREVRGVETW